jgi:hypothetical protein
MEQKFLDACVFSISNAPSTNGGFTFAARRSGAFLSPTQAGVVDQGLYRLFIYEPTTGDLEVRANCRWTQSTGTFSRGSLKRSSTGSPIAFTASAIVSVIDTDAAEQGRRAAAARSASTDLSVWASSKVQGIKAVALAMSRGDHIDLLPPPVQIAPILATGATRYVDSGWAGPFNGTFTEPYNNPAQASLAAGDQLLFKEGTTTNVSSHIFPIASGNATNRVIYGVYDAVTGNRIFGRVGAATIVSTDVLGAVFIIGAGKNYVCIDGLRLQAASVNTFGCIDTNGATHLTVTNCEIFGSGFAGIRFFGAGHVFQGNIIRNNAGDGIYVYQENGIAASATIQYNTIHNNAGSGVYAFDFYALGRFDCTVACNSIYNNGGVVNGRAGVSLLNGGGTALIYRNHIRMCPGGVGLASFATTTASFVGTRIENNDIEDAGEFGISTSAVRGLMIQCNRILRSGSFDRGLTPGVSTQYGRAVELWGPNFNAGTQDVVVRYNFISVAYGWLTDGSEGVGIGVDDHTRNFEVYGNYVELCEGNGIQCNRGFAGRVHGNILVDNLVSPASRGALFNNALAAQIFYIGTPWIEVFNNTCIYTGFNPNVEQKYGIAELDVVLSRGARLYNNVIVGASVAAIVRTQNAQGTQESYNKVLNCPKLVVAISTLADLAAGTNTGFISETAIDLESQIFSPTVGGALDGSGRTPVPAGAQSFSGKPLSFSTPIGATHPA